MDYLRHNFGTRHQHKTIPSHTCTVGFKVSIMKLCAVEEWNSLKQIIIFVQSSQLEKHLRFLKQNIAYLLLLWYSQITLYMWYFFGSSPRHQ